MSYKLGVARPRRCLRWPVASTCHERQASCAMVVLEFKPGILHDCCQLSWNSLCTPLRRWAEDNHNRPTRSLLAMFRPVGPGLSPFVRPWMRCEACSSKVCAILDVCFAGRAAPSCRSLLPAAHAARCNTHCSHCTDSGCASYFWLHMKRT